MTPNHALDRTSMSAVSGLFADSCIPEALMAVGQLRRSTKSRPAHPLECNNKKPIVMNANSNPTLKHRILAISLFLLAGAALFAAERKWHPAIFQSLQGDDPAPLRALIGAGFNIDAQDEASGETVLMMAAARNKLQIIKLLVNEGANLNLQDKNGSTALHRAAKESTEAVKLLLSANPKPDLALKTKAGISPAEMAAVFGKRESFHLLVSAGAPYEADLVFASALGDVADMNALIAKGADLNSTNKSGLTPLAAAARTGQMEALRLLLGKGANPDAGGSTTPLIMAAGWHRVDAASALLASGADPNRTNADGLTPLVNAIQVGDGDAVNLLLEKGAKASGVGNAYSPIHEAARSDDPRILRALIAHGAEINATFYSGNFTPLMVAASENKPKATAFLLKSGARVGLKANVSMEETDAFGGRTGRKVQRQMTALQMAENNGFETIVQIFQSPEAFDLGELDRDFTKPDSIRVQDWKRKYAEFDPERGRIATVSAFKKAFGEPTRITDIEETSFWYYRCADGLVEIKLVNPKHTGAQLVIQGFSTVSEPKTTGGSPLATPSPRPERQSENTQPGQRQPKTEQESPVEPKEANPRKAATGKTEGRDQSEANEAISNRERSMVRLVELLSQNDPQARKRPQLNSILWNAARQGFYHSASLCLENGAEIDATDPLGNTALMIAAQRGHLQVVQLLIKKGADIDRINRQRKTALELAKDPEVLAALKEAGKKQ